MFAQTVRRMSNRVPMIKFRQGAAHEPAGASASQPAPAGVKGKPNAVVSSAVIEDWQLPRRYRRRLISDEECEMINMGGAP